MNGAFQELGVGLLVISAVLMSLVWYLEPRDHPTPYESTEVSLILLTDSVYSVPESNWGRYFNLDPAYPLIATCTLETTP